MDALIGSTGFVGGTLGLRHGFGAQFNSATIHTAAGQDFDTVVCAAAPGSMFEANRFADRDGARIAGLMASLGKIRARRFVLISTIAVLADFASGADEDTAVFQTGLAYGANRRALEAFCADHFANCLILRLPALFGAGLKKNFLFDIANPMPSMLPDAKLHDMAERLPTLLRDTLAHLYRRDDALGMRVIDRAALDASGLRADFDRAVTDIGMDAVQFTHADSTFQYYDLTRLWDDIGVCHAHGLSLMHLAPAPLRAGDVFHALTGRAMPATQARLHHEDMRTRHAALWAETGPYIAETETVLQQLIRFHRQRGHDA